MQHHTGKFAFISKTLFVIGSLATIGTVAKPSHAQAPVFQFTSIVPEHGLTYTTGSNFVAGYATVTTQQAYFAEGQLELFKHNVVTPYYSKKSATRTSGTGLPVTVSHTDQAILPVGSNQKAVYTVLLLTPPDLDIPGQPPIPRTLVTSDYAYTIFNVEMLQGGDNGDLPGGGGPIVP